MHRVLAITARRLLLGAGVVLWGCGPEAVPGPTEAPWEAREGRAFGAGWKATWRGGAPADVVEPALVQVLEEVDLHLSTWRSDSELAAVRAGPGPVVVSEETASVVRAALDVAEATGGAFDPTVQPLMELWGLAGERRSTWPTDAEVEAARAQVGWQRVKLGHDPEGRPTVDAGGTALDVSALAPGHAADRLAWVLSAHGATDGYVDVGGEIRVAGSAPRGGPWRVGIERPVVGAAPAAAGLVATVSLHAGGVATSGNYRTRYTIGDRVVHHTMDPRTGRPASSAVLSATVIADDARTADAWATALMVLGEPGLARVNSLPLVEAWILVEGANGPEARHTDGALRWLEPSPTLGGAALPE